VEGITRWEHFSHEADIGVRGIGASREEAFEQAALAMIAAITDPQNVRQEETVELACEAPDDELLLVEWLNAVIYESATRRMLWGRFKVRIEGNRLRATAWGEQTEVARHQPAVEVKGATYTNLSVQQDRSGAWVAQCVVDV
jgi:tRNA nucleotidyltransferase (CCA-adding enzyme)